LEDARDVAGFGVGVESGDEIVAAGFPFVGVLEAELGRIIGELQSPIYVLKGRDLPRSASAHQEYCPKRH
jgi:hypothetical protein